MSTYYPQSQEEENNLWRDHRVFLPTRGVHTTPPSPTLLERLQPSIDREIAALPTDANGAFLTVANQTGGNLAVVARTTDGRLKVVGWVAKTWDTKGADYGVTGVVTW